MIKICYIILMYVICFENADLVGNKTDDSDEGSLTPPGFLEIYFRLKEYYDQYYCITK